jgi:hypothetical protein
MKIVTKNIKLEKGIRHYLVYLMDDNGNSIECKDAIGDEDRLQKENELSKEYGITTENVEFVSLDKFKSQNSNYTPLILVFYLQRDLFGNREMISTYGESVRKYLEDKGDDVRLFFLPTDEKEEIKCINPIYIDDNDEIEKLNELIEDISNKFQVGVE